MNDEDNPTPDEQKAIEFIESIFAELQKISALHHGDQIQANVVLANAVFWLKIAGTYYNDALPIVEWLAEKISVRAERIHPGMDIPKRYLN